MKFPNIAKVAGAGAFFLALTAVPAPAQAATISVPCNAADLINAVNTAAAGDTLSLTQGCVYTLDNTNPGPLVVNRPLTILGHGSVIQRDPSAFAFRIFTVNANLALDLVTIRNGDATGSFGGGLAVFTGRLTLTRTTVTNNRADFSGGIGVLGGASADIRNSAFTFNVATRNGGGIANDGTMTIDRTAITDNTAFGQNDTVGGGGIANDGELGITGSNVVRNHATGAKGGGIANILGGRVTTSGSNINTNDALGGGTGGGIANINSTVFLSRSNVNNNASTNAPGGIDNEGGAVTLDRTNVRNNTPTNCSPTPVPGCLG
ncbi:hypothetical protein ORV05_20630 [Amycolatopsis cynarae]|uniref:Polymorphic outer membrane protein n=1 Tax=Amycolatopsis cynarae TaxID=2995223 RepID=A0ABY7AUN5_9PSEU|nr:hypothetical protein [Amycolatopsis sp. HUAS 11-8]WAL63419.1 hypothetical protein ORV05_20630 [Amycolatopsis sp. HUAS 11-8]